MNCILDITKKNIDPITMREYQVGFGVRRSTINQIVYFLVIKLYQTTCSYDNKMKLFVEFRIAYVSIYKENLLDILKEVHCPQKLVNLVSISVIKTLVMVQVGNRKTDPVTMNLGLRLGNSIIHFVQRIFWKM